MFCYHMLKMRLEKNNEIDINQYVNIYLTSTIHIADVCTSRCFHQPFPLQMNCEIASMN